MKTRSDMPSRINNQPKTLQNSPVAGNSPPSKAAPVRRPADSFGGSPLSSSATLGQAGALAAAPSSSRSYTEQEYIDAVSLLYKYYGAVDTAGCKWWNLNIIEDGKISKDDLRAVVKDGGWAQEIKDACQFFLDNPEAFDRLESTTNGKCDGKIGKKDVEKALEVDNLTKEQKLICKNKDAINFAAQYYGIDPSLVAIVIYTEQSKNVDWTDAVFDVPVGFVSDRSSIGIGQVQVAAAKMLEEKGYIPESLLSVPEGLNENARRIARLNADQFNIFYVAAYIKLIQDTWQGEFPEIGNRPDIVWTLYNTGYLGPEKKGPHSDPGPGINADFAQENYKRMSELLK